MSASTDNIHYETWQEEKAAVPQCGHPGAENRAEKQLKKTSCLSMYVNRKMPSHGAAKMKNNIA